MKTGCPICKYSKVSQFFDIPEYYYCTNCKTAWLKKKPLITYSPKYYKAKSEFARKLFQPITNTLYLLRSIYVGPGRKHLWIDIGAGDGAYLLTVNSEQKLGVEISKFGLKKMKEAKINAIKPEVFLKKNNMRADVISLWHVLEHLDDPLKYLRFISKNLSKNGKIIVGLPNIDSFEFRCFRNKWFHLFPKYHIWHFSPTSLSILFKRASLKIKFIDYFSPEHHFSSCLQSFINSTSDSQNILLELFKRHSEIGNVPWSTRDLLLCIFWLTLGLPLVIAFWLISSITRKSSAIVIVATAKK